MTDPERADPPGSQPRVRRLEGSLAIVIPTVNEEERLAALLDDLRGAPLVSEIVVADGGSTDQTVNLALRAGAKVIRSDRPRARQMNAGARVCGAPWLLFLHADVRMPPPALEALGTWLEEARTDEVGTFAFALEGDHWFWRFLEFGQRIRERVSGLAYGDQGLVVSREVFWRAGGFADLPLLEDVEILRRLRREARWRPVPAPLISSPRRYESTGRWAGWLRNTAVIGLYLAGVPPKTLARFYSSRAVQVGLDPRRSDTGREAGVGEGDAGGDVASATPGTGRAATDRRELLIFAKAPVPGQVKTRLAASLGPGEAARVYREIGRRVVGQVMAGGYRVTVCYDPPGAEGEVARWLAGLGAFELRPQSGGDLGTRLADAIGAALQRSEAVIAIGTDAPSVDRHLVEEAFRRLRRSDVVLGPAQDGGYYLIGMSQLHPALFRGIPWSSPLVLRATVDAASHDGLVADLLPPLHDVDTLEDWRAVQAERAP